ncbi:MAG TPA: PQQ-binding-like beta-propeller repeat protein, partial [Acidimicrobiia bacterium]|nr:PQQ-binding-like beta-propeller repeat protein [Acidimicrobiia bacterium]
PQNRCLVWQERGGSFAADSRITTAPLLADGVLYLGTQGGIVHAVDAANGEELWSFDADARVEGIAVIPNVIFVTTADGTLIAIAGESGE